MTVLQVCAYGAEYAGNFIASLESLEKTLKEKGISTIYAFVDRAADKAWCKQIAARTQVYFLPESKARILPKTYSIFRKIYREHKVSIVHSHFELYDIPATVTAPRSAKIFWHLHDPINIQSQKMSRRILSKIQYGVVGKRAHLIAVANEYRKTVVNLGFPEKQTRTVVNGLNLDRVQLCLDTEKNHDYDFLTFGWDFYRKGDDLIISACDRLEKDGYKFKLLLNGNSLTWPKLDEYLKGRTPAYLVRGEPVEDVNELFRRSHVFIQASRRETFSYAVCEAAYAGMPVISTDIAGLEWAHDLPTVEFVASEDIEALYMAMKSYLDGKRLGKKDHSYSRRIVEERYSTAEWGKKVLECYNV